jgi:hypothetical protein
MASNTTIEFQVNRLVKTIEHSYRKWTRPDGSPSLPDVAENIKSWKDDIDRLGAFSQVNGPSYSKAIDGIQAAWNFRDDRKKAVACIQPVISALKGISGEMQTPDFRATYTNRTAKSLFGDMISRYSSDPNQFQDIYGIRRMLAGFNSMKSVSNIDEIDLRSGAEQLREFSRRYDAGTQLNGLAQRAADYMVAASRGENPIRVKSCISNAVKIVDQLGFEIEKSYSPSGYKTEMTGVAAKSVSDEVENVQRLMYGYHFQSPSTFLPQAVRSVKHLIGVMQNYYDPKAVRMAQTALEKLTIANQYSPAAKSMNNLGWQVPSISEPFNVALNAIDTLARHVTNRTE